MPLIVSSPSPFHLLQEMEWEIFAVRGDWLDWMDTSSGSTGEVQEVGRRRGGVGEEIEKRTQNHKKETRKGPCKLLMRRSSNKVWLTSEIKSCACDQRPG